MPISSISRLIATIFGNNRSAPVGDRVAGDTVVPSADREPFPRVEPMVPSNLFEIRTVRSTQLLVSREDGTLFHGTHDPAQSVRLLLQLVPSRPDISFLVADVDADRPISLGGDPDKETVVSLRLAWRDGGLVALAHPITGLFLFTDASTSGVAVAVTAMEHFALYPVQSVEPAAGAALSWLLANVGALSSAKAAAEAITTATSGKIRPLLRLLKHDEADWLGRLLRRDGQVCRAFADLYPHDVWAQQALPALSAMPAVRPRFAGSINQSLDQLALQGDAGRCESFPQLCNVHARRDVVPTRNVCLLASARNEGPYLLEWVAYHRAIGVEAFFLYTNDNDDGSEELLGALAAAGVIHWTSNASAPGILPQVKAYGHALQLVPDILDYRWTGIVDIDEFVAVNPDRYPSLPAFLGTCDVEPVDAVVLNWVAFGSNGHVTRTGQPVIERFTIRDAAVNSHVKTFLRPSRFIHAGAHTPYEYHRTPTVFRNASGAPHPKEPFSPFPEDTHAWVAHYAAKSAEEYILRRSLNRGNMAVVPQALASVFEPGVAYAFVDQHRRGGSFDDRVARLSPRLHEELERLRALPGVVEAEQTIERLYRRRIAALAETVAADARFTTEGTPEQWFLEILRSSSGAAPPS